MSTKKFCDLCGKAIDNEGEALKVYVSPISEKPIGASYFFARDSWCRDVCLECAEIVAEVLKIEPLLMSELRGGSE